MVSTWSGWMDTEISSFDVESCDFFSSVTLQSHACSNFKYLLPMPI